MNGVAKWKQSRIPIDSKQTEVIQKRVIVDPEDTVIHLRSRFRIVSQQLLQFLSPMAIIEFGVVSLPTKV